MNRRLLLGPVLSLSALIAGAALLSPPAAAGGVTVKQYGWWTINNYDPTFTAPYAGPDGADLHVAYGPNPDAAEKQDTGGPVNGATQVSAAEYDLPIAVPDGTSPESRSGLSRWPWTRSTRRRSLRRPRCSLAPHSTPGMPCWEATGRRR